MHWLMSERRGQVADVISRFDPRFWTVNFPRPSVAAVTTTGPDALRVDVAWGLAGDLVGLIWEAADRFDHPLLGHETRRDFRDCRLRFRWRSGGVAPLDAVDGAVLTIEGRAADGAAFTAYVRLWNHATGTGEDAGVSLDFANLRGGFGAGGPAVWAGDVDRMFVSLVPPGYAAGGVTPIMADGWAELTELTCEGPGSVLAIGDAVVPEHVHGIATGYDDQYHMTPARLLRHVVQLGYRGAINHYVGMSHFMRLGTDGLVAEDAPVMNVAAAAWHRDFAARAHALGLGVIWSVSFELLAPHCPAAWMQRASDGSPALTGYEPPSALLSPAHDGAMAWLRSVAGAVMAIAVDAGLAPLFQVGEPWWWVTDDGRPCLYDASAVAAFAPVPIASVRGALTAAQCATLDRAGTCLATATAGMVAAARTAAPGCVSHLLAYLPGVLDPAAPDVRRANLPIGWASPAFDVLQLEDYSWCAAGDIAATARAVAQAGARLGYPAARQHHLAGFVADAGDAGRWPAIVAAADAARARGVAAAYLWALPQVIRDGLVVWDGEDAMQPFDDVAFPLALGARAEVAPEVSTTIHAGAGGAEQRLVNWASPRTRYDVGPGLRSEADVATLLAFFRARLGPARAFRFTDPFDHDATGEPLGVGDGVARRFALVKRYGDEARRITRPVAGSIVVRVGGAAVPFALLAGGLVELDAAPAAGVAVVASFGFDVPVRFADDRLSVSRATYLAGEVASVPLVEVREG